MNEPTKSLIKGLMGTIGVILALALAILVVVAIGEYRSWSEEAERQAALERAWQAAEQQQHYQWPASLIAQLYRENEPRAEALFEHRTVEIMGVVDEIDSWSVRLLAAGTIMGINVGTTGAWVKGISRGQTIVVECADFSSVLVYSCDDGRLLSGR